MCSVEAVPRNGTISIPAGAGGRGITLGSSGSSEGAGASWAVSGILARI